MARRDTPTWAELRRQLAESRRQSEDADRRLTEQLTATDAQIAELGRKIGELANGWGQFVESIIMPGIGPALERFGYDVDGVTGPAKRRRGGGTFEADSIAVATAPDGRRVVLAAQIRSRLDASYVLEWVADLPRFRNFFPEYRDHDLEGVVAGIRVGDGVDRVALREGLFILVPSGETVVAANPAGFRARVWSR